MADAIGLIAAVPAASSSSGVAGSPDASDIVSRGEDHLCETAERLVRDGRTPTDAEAEAVARFGSAVLIARVCAIESNRGAAVPTTHTRAAGLAALLTPVLLVVGQYLNVTVDRGSVHGIGVAPAHRRHPDLHRRALGPARLDTADWVDFGGIALTCAVRRTVRPRFAGSAAACFSRHGVA